MRNLSSKMEEVNLGPKMGGKLRPISTPDLGDRSHCRLPWWRLQYVCTYVLVGCVSICLY